MNKIFIIGRLTKDPESRTSQKGTQMVTFNVAVPKRVEKGEHPESEFFRVITFGNLANVCQLYLSKGRQVHVTGSVSAEAYTARNGDLRASMTVLAEGVEFLGSNAENDTEPLKMPNQANLVPTQSLAEKVTFTPVEDDEDLPF